MTTDMDESPTATDRPPDRPPRRLLPVKVVAKTLGIGKTKAYELIASGELPAVRIGAKLLVRADDLDAYVIGLEYVRPTILPRSV